jgi:hypothetical protein
MECGRPDAVRAFVFADRVRFAHIECALPDRARFAAALQAKDCRSPAAT